MTTILLNDFIEFSFLEIYRSIMLMKETAFTVQFKRNVEEPCQDIYVVLPDFYIAAYLGEKLNEVSDVFSYWVPEKYADYRIFSFEIEVKDLEKFIDVIYFIVKVYMQDDYTEEYAQLDEAALNFHRDVIDEVIEPACPGLIYVVNELFIQWESYESKHFTTG